MKTFVWVLIVTAIVVIFFNLFSLEIDRGERQELREEVEVVGEHSIEFSEPRSVRLLHMGDTMLDRGVKATITQGVDPFGFVKDFISEGNYDLAIANLEGPFTHNIDCQVKPYSFRFEPEYVSFLKDANINAVALSNNHSLDCYRAGLDDTKKILTEAEIEYFGGFEEGGGQILYKDFDDIRISFLSFDDTMKIQSHDEMSSAVKKAGSLSDFVLVHIHWGEEYFADPVESQRSLAKRLVDAGVDLIVGHHPHVIEPVEVIDGVPVFYSLGNFVFDQLTKETKTGFMLETEVVTAEGKIGATLHPYFITSNQPSLLGGEEKLNVCQEVVRYLGESDDPCNLLFTK